MNDEVTVLPYIVGAAVITYAATQAPPKQPVTIDPLIGMFVLGTLLLLLGIWSPELATAFALLVFLTALVVNGYRLVGAVSNSYNNGSGGTFTAPRSNEFAGTGGGGGGAGAR